MRSTILEERSDSVPTLLASRRRSDWWLYLVLVAVATGLTPVLVYVASVFGFRLLLVGAVVLAVLIATAWRPIFGLYLIAVCALVIESQSLPTNIFTDRLTVYYWPTQISGIPERPLGLYFLFVLAVVVCQRLARREHVLYGGKVLVPLLLFLATVAMGAVHGLASGGVANDVVLEVRPFWWLFVCYVLAHNLATTKRHIVAFMWIVVLGGAFKGLQALYIVVTVLQGHLAGQNEIMAHEQSYFWVCMLLLLLISFLHHRFSPHFYVALAAAPLVIIGLEANNRRADYLALLVGGVVAWLLTIAVRPQARTRLIVSLTLCLVMGGAYVLVFSHVGGALGRPAQAIVSAISPDATDVRNVDSNQYRTIENFDLQFTESQSPLLGYGFGKPFLQHTALPNIVGLDPIYLLVPHNNIYWIWMRLGPLGYLALWYLIGVITVRGCLIVRELRDNFLQQFAIFVIAATFMEVLLAYADYQLFFFRNVIFLGLTVGMLFKLPAIDKATDAATAVSAVTPSENQLVAARQA
jgi:hypothetical protein